MALTPRLNSIEALFQKLERELYRTLHSTSSVHQADHFYNFCITAHSMRDYFRERVGPAVPAAHLEHEWSTKPELIAVADIANSAKHFVLRHNHSGKARTPLTRLVKPTRITMVDFYLSTEGSLMHAKRPGVPSFTVVPFDGHAQQLSTFMMRVLDYWKQRLAKQKIRPRKQPHRLLAGPVT